jgi:hypothetical protein
LLTTLSLLAAALAAVLVLITLAAVVQVGCVQLLPQQVAVVL